MKNTELIAALQAAEGKPLESTAEALDLYMDVCRGCVLEAEELLGQQSGRWEIASLARTCLKYATYLEGFEHTLNSLYNVLNRLSRCIFDHPRLKLKVLRLLLTVLRRIEAQTGHGLGLTEDVTHDVRFLERNIEFADRGELDQIREEGHLRHDPVEWTARYEEVVDEVDRLVDEALADMPRGMGFCHAVWHTRAEILRERFGIEWRSPAVMNPRVMFD